jgi:hypothetical protein
LPDGLFLVDPKRTAGWASSKKRFRFFSPILKVKQPAKLKIKYIATRDNNIIFMIFIDGSGDLIWIGES